MRVALVCASLDEPTRGNHTTVRRWLRHARDVELCAVAPGALPDVAPDVVHGYHALHGGPAALELARRFDRPLVVSLGGTDLRAFLERDPVVTGVLRAADRVTGAFDAFGEMLGPDVGYATVPRAIEIPAVEPRAAGATLRALLPAGLRPEKDPLLALDLVEELARRGLPLRLELAGPPMDAAYARRVLDRARALGVEHREWAPEAMAAAYRRADVVWNTSRSEGGANAILEAVAYGAAVLARDVPGNRCYFEPPGIPGALFDPEDLDGVEAFHRALLAESAADRAARVARGHAWLRERHDPAREADALAAVWRAVRRA